MTEASARATTVGLTGAQLGPPSRLPAYAPVRPRPFPQVDAAAPPQMRERVARGRLATPLPYGLRSDYDRGAHPLRLPGVVLANDQARVTILPTLGGRVWSFVDLTRGRELLYVPDQLRFAAFGLSDAWFAGGIEWNFGSFGHTTLTTEPMHAAVVPAPDGSGEGVRLWDWERTRDVPFSVDLWLDGPRLMASTRLVNLDPEDKPLYWWTNIAVPETDGTRVLVPATHAWRTDYRGVLSQVPVPQPGGDLGDTDVSRPAASHFAADYFFEVEDQVGRIVTAFEPDGRGFAQTSTAALRGRKLFLWGRGPGGRRWQRHLGGDAGRYAEIQAGVCATQLEHDLLPGGGSISWTECFTGVDLPPEVVAGDYAAASEAARAAVHEQASPERLEQLHATWLREVAEAEPGESLHVGSGWGRTELTLRGSSAPVGMPFPAAASGARGAGDDDSATLLPLADGEPVDADPLRPPLPGVSNRWRSAVSALAGRPDAGWWPLFAEAVHAHLDGDTERARDGYRRSLAVTPSAVALRGLALLSDDVDEADDLLRRAFELAPHERRLVTERLEKLVAAGRFTRVLDVEAALPDEIRRHGRTRLLLATALAGLGATDRARAVLDDLEVADLAEGDNATAELWWQVSPGTAVPERLDFRMSRDDPVEAS